MARSFWQPVSELCPKEEKLSHVGVPGPSLVLPTWQCPSCTPSLPCVVGMLSSMPMVTCGYRVSYSMCPGFLDLGP